jgi:hypothetical protein
MFVINHLQDRPREIGAHAARNVRFLKKHYAATLASSSRGGRFRAAVDHLAVGKGRQEIEAIIKEDPFIRNGLAEFHIGVPQPARGRH